MIVVYIKADRHVEIKNPKVCVGDVSKIYCSNHLMTETVKAVEIFHFNIEENGQKKTASIMAVIAAIDEQLNNEEICMMNIGENDFAMSLNFSDRQSSKAPWYKVLPVVLITFFGSIFSIMTYNEDVDTMGVFEKIAGIAGTGNTGVKLMAVSYAAGIAAGLIIFFNHFGRKKITDDPTPMEVEMEKYETDVEDTWIKESSRKGKSIDVP